MDNKNTFISGIAGKGIASKVIKNNGQFLAGIIKDKKSPLSELVEIVGVEDMEPIDYNKHIAHGVHVRVTKTQHEEYMGVYEEKHGYCIIDLESGIFTNEYHRDKGVPKQELLKSWINELGINKARLLNHNYPIKRVLSMSEEEAESEIQAIGYDN